MLCLLIDFNDGHPVNIEQLGTDTGVVVCRRSPLALHCYDKECIYVCVKF